MNNFYNDKEGRYFIKPVTIETADQSIFDYFDKKLSIKVDAERGRTKVPIVFATGERWKLIRKNKFRDENGTLILPIISIKRTEIDRTPGFRSMGQETPQITIAKSIHPKTSNIQNTLEQQKDNGFFPRIKEKVVYDYLTIPFPDFSTIFYEMTVWSQYQTQVNEIFERIFYAYEHADSFVIPVEYDGDLPKGNGYYFVGFREGNIFSQSNIEEFSGEERILKYVYLFKVPVYLILDPKDETLAYGRQREEVGSTGKKVVYKHQSSTDISFGEETISLEDFKKNFG